MKKTLLILAAMILFLGGCRKFDEIEASKVEMNDVTIERGWDYIKISGGYDYPVELETMTLYLSEKEDLSGAKTYSCNVEGKTFSVEVKDLKEGTRYYYQYEYDNGYEKEKSKKENVATYAMPVVVTKDVTNITANSAYCGGNVTDDGNGTVTARGICWSETHNPTINNIYSEETNNGTGTGSFTSQLTNLKENTTYYVRAYATYEKGTIYGEEKSFKTESLINGYDWVDLGLPSGLKWATCNVGASSPEDYGDYFAWGETETKSEYTESNSLTHGLTISGLHSQGYIDGSGNLTPSHDAATANWGGSWRMPTESELEELENKCTWTWTTQNGVNGRKVTGPNGNHIFLPAAGGRYETWLSHGGDNGYYWSSTPYDGLNDYEAYYLYFYDGDESVVDYLRFGGQTVRPITE